METNQSFCSNSSREMRGFIFNRLLQTDNQKTLYTLRRISKSEQERVEKKIQTAKINFGSLEKFATSKFNERIKFLEVCLRESQDSYESFKYLSTTYLPYALNINAKVLPSSQVQMDGLHIDLDMREPLTFRRLHIVNYGGYAYNRGVCFIRITGKYNVEIRDCEFIGISVYCKGNANVYVTGSKFTEGKIHGLGIKKCDSVYINEITSGNSEFAGLDLELVKGVVNVTNVRVNSCAGFGIYIGENVAKFKLSNTIIKDCGTGIHIEGQCSGQIQKTNIEGCGHYGILLTYGAIVHYAAVEFKHNKQDVQIRDDGSQFLQLENI